MALEWTNDLTIGEDLIDAQHRELFVRMDRLLQAIREKTCKYEVGPTLEFLEEYVVKHFGDEQKLMQESGYPAYEEHKALHDKFVEDFAELKDELSRESSNYSRSAYVNKMIVDWIVDHIKQRDIEFGKYLLEKIRK